MSIAYIKIARKLFATDPFWLEPRTFSRLEAWLDLLQMAAWGNRTTTEGLKLERGQVEVAQRGLARRWNWSRGRVQRFLSTLEVMERVSIAQASAQGDAKHRDKAVVTIRNYDLFQGGSQTPAQTPPATAEAHETPAVQGILPGTPPPPEKPKRKADEFVDAALALYDECGAERPPIGWLNLLRKNTFKGYGDWMLRELKKLAESGYLSRGTAYTSKALKGAAARATTEADGWGEGKEDQLPHGTLLPSGWFWDATQGKAVESLPEAK